VSRDDSELPRADNTELPRADDTELLRAHAAGDPDAFNELVRRHRDRLWAVAVRTVGDPEEAADAVQDALISAFRRAESFRAEAQVTTWLHRIVVNACLDRVRRRKARQTEPLPEDEERAAVLSQVSGDDPAEVRERRADVMRALDQIAPEQRAALVLVDMEGYSVDEAAKILDCPVGTVKSRCSRGRARLVPLLTQYGPQTSERNPAATDNVSAEAAQAPNLPSTTIPSHPTGGRRE
jgi:RNA polymerase sigma factor (sigma-70 family)